MSNESNNRVYAYRAYTDLEVYSYLTSDEVKALYNKHGDCLTVDIWNGTSYMAINETMFQAVIGT